MFFSDILFRVVFSPFVIAWRRLRACRVVPGGIQATLADDIRSSGLIEQPPYDAVHERVAQRLIRDNQFRPSISMQQAMEQLFIALDEVQLTESSGEAAEVVAARLAWRVNSGNLR